MKAISDTSVFHTKRICCRIIHTYTDARIRTRPYTCIHAQIHGHARARGYIAALQWLIRKLDRTPLIPRIAIGKEQ